MARPTTDVDRVREELLDCIEAIIQQRGGKAVTLAELAAAADMSPANVYRFFENKDALYEAVAERWFAPKVRIMEEVIASDLGARDKLYEFYARRFRLMRENHDADPVLFSSYLELGREHFDVVRGYIDLGDQYLAMIVADAMGEGYFTQLTVDETVSLINLMVHTFCDPEMIGLLHHSLSEPKLAQIIDTIFAGLGRHADRKDKGATALRLEVVASR